MKSIATTRLLLALAAAAGALHAGAQEASSWTLGGSVDAQPYAAYADGFSYGSSTTLALDLEAKGDRARAEASIETALLTGVAAQTAWAVAGSPFARKDELLLPAYAESSSAPDTLVAARIRSLYLKLELGRASLTAGRQVVNYGRGALWSPTDIFTELDLTGLSPLRRGTDSLRLVVPLGATEGLDIVAAPAAALEEGRYALRLRALALGVDGAVMTARDGAGNGTVVGADFKADLELGFYGEASYELYDSGRTGTLKAAGGADYSLGDFILAAEYYYNGGGAASDPLFPGSHNVYGSATWKASELLQFSLTAVWDATDGSGTGTLVALVSATQNATLEGFLQSGYGQSSYGLSFGSEAAALSTEAGMSVTVKF